MARKFKFTVKEGAADKEPCCLIEEDHAVIVYLQPPANIKHAEKVAAFLNANVQDVKVLTGTARLGAPSGMKAIGGNWVSLFDAEGGTEVGNG